MQHRSHPIVFLSEKEVRNIERDYKERCVIGLLFSTWIQDNWLPLGVEVELIQMLPNGYYNFLLKEANMTFKILGAS